MVLFYSQILWGVWYFYEHIPNVLLENSFYALENTNKKKTTQQQPQKHRKSQLKTVALANICGFSQISMESWLNISPTDTMCYLQDQLLISCMFRVRKTLILCFWKLDGNLKSTYFFWDFKIYFINSNFGCLIKGKIKTSKKKPHPKIWCLSSDLFLSISFSKWTRWGMEEKRKNSQFLWFLLLK